MDVDVALRGRKKVEAKEADFALSNHARAPGVSAFLARFDLCNHRLIEHSKHSHKHNLLLPTCFAILFRMAAPPGLAHIGDEDRVTVDRAYLNALVRRRVYLLLTHEIVQLTDFYR
jgi:hypothetical protein